MEQAKAALDAVDKANKGELDTTISSLTEKHNEEVAELHKTAKTIAIVFGCLTLALAGCVVVLFILKKRSK